MSSVVETAVVICPQVSGMRTKLLGLEVGQRLLLALSYGGIKKVAFVGEGERPSCHRATLQVVSVESLATHERHLILASDTVFDKGLLTIASLPQGSALALADGELLRGWLAHPLDAERELGPGNAISGKDFAIRVGDRKSAKQAERALLLSLRKPIDGFVSTHLNRHVSLFITRALVKTGLPPNFFTVVFTAIGLTSAVLATQAQHAWALVAAGLLFQAQSILDGCDGEMARLTYKFSRSGQWLDSIGDDTTNYSVCFGLAIGQARVLHDSNLVYLGAAVLLMQVVTSAVLYRRMLIMGTGDLLAIPDLVRAPSSGGALSAVGDFISVILKRDTFIFLLSALVIAQQPLLAFYLYGIGTIPMAAGVLLNDYRIGRANQAQTSL